MRHRGLEMRLGKFGCRHKRRLEVGECFERPVQPAQRMTAIGQDLRMIWHRRECRVVARDRPHWLVQPQQRVASIDQRADMTGRLCQRALVARQRVIEAPQFEAGIGEIIENLRMIRRQLQRVAKARNRFVKAAGGVQRQTEIRHRIRRSRIGLQRRRQEMQRFHHALALEIEHAEQMQRIEIVRPMLENAGAELLRPVQVAVLKRGIRLPLQARQVRHPAGAIFPLCRQLAVFPGKRQTQRSFESVTLESTFTPKVSIFRSLRPAMPRARGLRPRGGTACRQRRQRSCASAGPCTETPQANPYCGPRRCCRPRRSAIRRFCFRRNRP